MFKTLRLNDNANTAITVISRKLEELQCLQFDVFAFRTRMSLMSRGAREQSTWYTAISIISCNYTTNMTSLQGCYVYYIYTIIIKHYCHPYHFSLLTRSHALSNWNLSNRQRRPLVGLVFMHSLATLIKRLTFWTSL